MDDITALHFLIFFSN